jgi:hypothetical protein
MLDVSPQDVAQWLSGAALPQDAAYRAALDIVARGPSATDARRSRPGAT